LKSLGWRVLTVWECETRAGTVSSGELIQLLRKKK
jgi:G:T-mismatch repair DNA endonuclease (very short patch repair protein)